MVGRSPILFVVGSSRSGTTMMARILGRHPRIFTLRELHFFEQLWTPEERDGSLDRAAAERLAARLWATQERGFLERGNAEDYLTDAREMLDGGGLSSPSAPQLYAAFLRLQAGRANKEMPCVHTPRNAFYLGEILNRWPEARVIRMARDPRDVLLSQKRKWRRRQLGAAIPRVEALRARLNYHPYTISRLWVGAQRAVERFHDDERVTLVRFEDLLDEPQNTMRRICAWIGISFVPGMLDVPQIGSSSLNDRPGLTGIDRSRAGAWRSGGLSRTEVWLCQRTATREMRNLGYAESTVRPHPLGLAWSLLSLPCRLALALAINLPRARSLTRAVQRRLLGGSPS